MEFLGGEALCLEYILFALGEIGDQYVAFGAAAIFVAM